jgi:hypothetical protein
MTARNHLASPRARTLAALVISVLLLGGCIPGHTVEEPMPGQGEVIVTGTLTGVRTQAEECVWLIDRTGRKFDLWWLPTGWSVAYEPIRVIGRTPARSLRPGHVTAAGALLASSRDVRQRQRGADA